MILLLTTNTESGSVSTRSPSLPCIIKLEEPHPPVASSPNLTNYPNYRRGRIGHGRRQDERVLAVETSPLSSSGLAHRLDKGRIDPRCRLGFRPRSTRPEVTPGLFPGAVHSGSTPAVRKKPIVSYSHKPPRQDMEQEPSGEFFHAEGHLLHCIAVSIVLPLESHLSVCESNQPLIGYGYSMCVAGQIL